MFESLSQRLVKTIRNVSGRGRLTEENIKEVVRELRLALLDADVALPVVKDFIARIKESAIGQEVMKSLRPGEALIKIVHDELIHLLGDAHSELNLKVKPPAVILMAGLQGSGKTTTVAKLANYLKNQENKSVMVVSADIYRPAAIDQLATLAASIGVEFMPTDSKQTPVAIAEKAISEARRRQIEVVLVDTAGRLHVDEAMMSEIKAIHAAISPAETLFVIDSMAGQDAARVTKAFSETIDLTGVVLTKVDGDARGGAALSVRMVSGKPIKFVGVGEKVDAFEPFHPQRIVSRLLDQGDIAGLVEEVQRKIGDSGAKKVSKKLKKGGKFDLQDFLEQLQQMSNMGGITTMLSKIPGMQQMPGKAKSKFNDEKIKQQIAVIQSMTLRERRFPALIKGSRKKRIASGSGVEVQKVNHLLREFSQMQKMMKKLSSKGGMKKMMRQMGGMPGGGMPGMPTGLPDMEDLPFDDKK
ncbi:MAG: signal recognition particle protein [Gammaproteobacteria bacterium]|nr:signal recognition particle protein [Gammaproteobacteria bacterium]